LIPILLSHPPTSSSTWAIKVACCWLPEEKENSAATLAKLQAINIPIKPKESSNEVRERRKERFLYSLNIPFVIENYTPKGKNQGVIIAKMRLIFHCCLSL